MRPFRPVSRRRGVSVLAIAAMALVACAGPFCHDTGFSGGAEFKTAEEARGATPTETPAATVTTNAKASATGPASATATSSATTAATAAGTAPPKAATSTATSTATTVAPPAPTTKPAVRLRATAGVDHPPFVRNYGFFGNSTGLACVSGIPPQGVVMIQITGGTGAPPSVQGTGGPDGTVIIPFPIDQYGDINGTITSLRVGGQPVDFFSDPFSYRVGETEQMCVPPPAP